MITTSNLNNVGIIGAGAMGAGIAQVAAVAGHNVFIFDMSAETAQAGLISIKGRIDRLVQKNKLTEEAAFDIKKRIKVISSIEEMAEADLIVEAIIENLEVKQRVFSQLEEIVSEKTILTTNTSSISITAIASSLKHPERFAGFHCRSFQLHLAITLHIFSSICWSTDNTRCWR